MPEISTLCQRIQELHFDDKASQHALEGWKEKIAKINTFNNVDKYKVVFIGAPGVGKTTAICNWLDLIHVENDEDPKRSHDLLATGSGNTTVAEVHIRQVSEGSSRIRLEYHSDEAQKDYIKDYTAYYYRTCMELADEGDDEDGTQPIHHTEIDRIIRTMASLDVIPARSATDWDSVVARVREFQSLEEFQNYVISRIDLNNRKAPEIVFEGGNFKDWLYKTFRDVNFGRNIRCSIPKCIHVDINIDDLNMHIPAYVSEIVDTLGLDSEVGARPDLQKFMNEEDTICILVDDITNPPSINLRNVIKNSFVAGSEYLKEKVALYIRLKEDELENVPGADGNRDEGLRLKQDGLNACVSNNNVPYKVENTKFMNSKEAYNVSSFSTRRDGRKVIERLLNYEEEIATESRNEICHWFEQMIDELKEKLSEDATAVGQEVERLVEAQRQNDQRPVEVALRNIKNNVLDRRNEWETKFMDTQVAGNMAVTLYGIHWATIRAMNRRYGGYDTYHTDVYTQFMQSAKNDFANKANRLKQDLKNIFKSDNEAIQVIANGYVQRIENKISASINELGDKLLSWLLNESEMHPQSYANQFWSRIQGLGGTGYKRRVIDRYNESLKEKRFDIARMFQHECNAILDDVVSWLPQ